MAITENKYTGDGSTVLYSFTFPYLEVADIKVSLDGTLTTEYILANATQIEFNTAPANGVAIRLYRQTDDDALAAQFFPGSAIRARDLNDNFTQTLYLTQESNRNAGESVGDANEALAKANEALAKSNEALTTADAADAKAQQALDAVGNALLYILVPDVAAIPATPEDQDAVEVFDATGIESFTPLTGVPVGFVGDPGLSVRIIYDADASTWTWVQYFPNDPDNRYGLGSGSGGGSLVTDGGNFDNGTSTISTSQTLDGGQF